MREGLGGPETWRKCEESAVVFAQRAIMESIGEECWNLLQRNVEYHLTVSDVAARDGEDTLLGNGRLAVTIECSGCGFLKFGPAIAALEEEAEGLSRPGAGQIGAPGCASLISARVLPNGRHTIRIEHPGDSAPSSLPFEK